MTAAALDLARYWFYDETTAEQETLMHALRVARVVMRHDPDTTPEVVSAALLHDVSEAGPADALEAVARTVSGDVARILQAIRDDAEGVAPLPAHPAVLAVVVANHIDALTGLAVAADVAPDPAGHLWSVWPGFTEADAHLRRLHRIAVGRIPATMTDELGRLVAHVEQLATAGSTTPTNRRRPTHDSHNDTRPA